MITGEDHLERLLGDVRRWTLEAARAWVAEDQASAMPRSGDGTGSRTGTSDPVAGLVQAGRRTQARDRLGDRLEYVHRQLRDLAAEVESPR